MSDFIDVPVLLMFLAFVAIIMAVWLDGESQQ